MQELIQRYRQFTWGNPDAAVVARLSGSQLQQLDHWPELLKQHSDSVLMRDACLLSIQAAIVAGAHTFTSDTTPSWLEMLWKALNILPSRRWSPELVALCGRSREHCSRAIKQHLGMTLREFVNQRRLTAFVQRLTDQDRPIQQIAAEVWAGHQPSSIDYLNTPTAVVPVCGANNIAIVQASRPDLKIDYQLAISCAT